MYKKERDPITKAAIQKFIDDKAQDLAPQDLVSYCLSICKGFEQYGEKDAWLMSLEAFTPLNEKFHLSDKLIDWHLENLKKNGIGAMGKVDLGGFGVIDHLFIGLLKKGVKGKIGKPLETRFLAIHPAYYGKVSQYGDNVDGYEFKWQITIYGFTSNHFNFNRQSPGFDRIEFEPVGDSMCYEGCISNEFFQVFSLKEGDKFNNRNYHYYFHSHIAHNAKITLDSKQLVKVS
jgi:hypothetical protein